MAKSDPQLEAYLQSRQNSLAFILELAAKLDRLPELALVKTPKLAKIKLENQKKISVERAWQIIINFLETHQAPYTLRQRTKGWRLNRDSLFAINLYLQRADQTLQAQNPEQLNQLVEQYRQTQTLTPTPETTAYQKALSSWQEQIQTYNQQIQQFQRRLASQLPPPIGSDLFSSEDYQIIAAYLATKLTQISGPSTSTPDQIQLGLAKISADAPEPVRRYLTLLHAPQNANYLNRLVNQSRQNLAQLRQTQTSLALNPPPSLPPTEIERQLYLLLSTKTNLGQVQASKLAREVVSNLTADALSLSPHQPQKIINQTLRKHHLDSEVSFSLIQPLLPHLTRHHLQTYQDFKLAHVHHAIGPITSWMLKTIIRETDLTPDNIDPKRIDAIKKYLGLRSANEEQLLQAIQTKLQRESDPSEIQTLLQFQDSITQRLHLNQGVQSRLLRWSTKLLLRSYQNNLIISSALNRYALAYKNGLDLYLKAEYYLSGEWLIKPILNYLEDLKNRPILGWFIAPVEKFSLWKRQFVITKVNQWLKALQTKTGLFSTSARKLLRLFSLGDYTINGLIVESTKAAAVWVYTKTLAKLVEKSGSWGAKALTWFGRQFVILSSNLQKLTDFLGLSLGFITQFGILAWNFLSDSFQFGRDFLHALGAPSFGATIAGLWTAFRRWGAKNITGLIGALAGLAIGGPVLALAGFLFGHEIGRLLNAFYEKFLRPFGLFITSFVIFAISSIAAITFAGWLFVFLGPIILVPVMIFFLTIVSASTRLPDTMPMGTFPIAADCTNQVVHVSDKAKPDPSDTIAFKAYQIVDHLKQGFWCYWNLSPDYPNIFDYSFYSHNPNPREDELNNNPNSLFWCTQLIVKAYKEAGFHAPGTLSADSMYSLWPPDKRIDATKANSTNILPGAVIFFHTYGRHEGANHVAIVTKVTPTGMYYVQSNGPVKSGLLGFDPSGSGVDELSWATILGIGNP